MPNKEKNHTKILAAVLIAAMSAYSTYMSTYASSKSDNNQQATERNLIISNAKNEALIDLINTVVIPQIKEDLEEIEYSQKEQSQDESASRKRIARLEAIVENLPKRYLKESPKMTIDDHLRVYRNSMNDKKTKINIPMIQQSTVNDYADKLVSKKDLQDDS